MLAETPREWGLLRHPLWGLEVPFLALRPASGSGAPLKAGTRTDDRGEQRHTRRAEALVRRAAQNSNRIAKLGLDAPMHGQLRCKR
jgi:hypothetical protein